MLRHLVDGEALKDFDKLHPNFVNEPRNIILGLVTDRFNSFGNMSLSFFWQHYFIILLAT